MNNSRRKRIKESTLMLVGALERLRKIYAAERDKQVADFLKEAISGLEDTIKTMSDAGFCEPATKQPTKSRGYDSALDPNSKKIVALATASFACATKNFKLKYSNK